MLLLVAVLFLLVVLNMLFNRGGVLFRICLPISILVVMYPYFLVLDQQGHQKYINLRNAHSKIQFIPPIIVPFKFPETRTIAWSAQTTRLLGNTQRIASEEYFIVSYRNILTKTMESGMERPSPLT